jgi:hypothetical protein
MGWDAMINIKIGDTIRINDRADWPSPPGYRLADSEGEVILVREDAGFVTIRLIKTATTIPKETCLTLRLENVEKV